MKIFNHSSERLHGLDHLRAIAIILVMIFHFGRGIPSWLEPVKQIGWTGVDLFFVLSGFLIGYQLLKEVKDSDSISFKRFYIKRFFRIIPTYLVVLVIYYSLPTLRDGAGLPPLWRFLTFTQNYGLDAQTQNTFSHAWSLCIEEQFYLLLPISITLFFRFKYQKATPYILLGLVVIGFVLRFYSWNEFIEPFIESGDRRGKIYGFIEKIYYPGYNRMDGLLVGVGIAAIFNFKLKLRDFLVRHSNILLIVGLGVFLIAYHVCESFISYRTAIYGFPLISLAYGLIVLAAVSPGSILYKLKSKLTFIIATLSYAVYLSHKLVYYLVKHGISELGIEISSAWVFWICMIMALIAGLVLHVIIEKPSLRFRKRLLNSENSESGNILLKYHGINGDKKGRG